MTSFQDGPAEGKVLLLKRAPHWLRVVIGAAGEVDALDQLTDTPDPTEKVYAYVMVSGPTRSHVNMGRRGCNFYQGGHYRLCEEQPEEWRLRDTDRWRAWVSDQLGRPVAEDGTAEAVDESR
jgi:hypothetical protein